MKALFSILAVVISVNLSAQLLPNSDFEYWEASSQEPESTNWQNPQGWSTSNASTEAFGEAVEPSPYSYTGTFAARVKTISMNGDHLPGMLVAGSGAILDPAGGQVNVTRGGIPMQAGIAAINGFYTFSSPSYYDSAQVEVYVKHWSATTQSSSIIGSSVITLSSAGTYTYFEIPVSYTLPAGESIDPSTDTLVVAFYSTKPSLPRAGGQLTIDNLFTYGLGAEELTPKPFTVYPNPVASGGNLNLDLPLADEEAVDLTMTDLTGRVVFTFKGMYRAIRKKNIPTCRPGGYILTAQAEGNMYQQRVLVTQ